MEKQIERQYKRRGRIFKDIIKNICCLRQRSQKRNYV